MSDSTMGIGFGTRLQASLSPRLLLSELLLKQWFEPVIPFTLMIALLLWFSATIPNYAGMENFLSLMRLYAEYYLTHVASLASPGLDELRWLKPVRPGDRLSVRVTVLKAAPSRSKPDRGAVTSLIEVFNQADEPVMTMKVVNINARRPAA